MFYELYEETFIRAYNKFDLPIAVELFLNFGYVSEKLLNKDTLNYLVSRAGVKFTGTYGKDGKKIWSSDPESSLSRSALFVSSGAISSGCSPLKRAT